MGYVDGKRKRKRWISKASTKAAATEEMNDELYKLNRVTRAGGITDNDYPVADLAEQWFKSLDYATSLSESTKNGYRPLVDRIINTLDQMGVESVESIDSDTAEQMLSIMISEVSHNTSNKCLAKLKAILNYGVEKKLLVSNPISNKRRLPTKRVKERRALTHEEAASLLEISAGTMHHLLWLWLLSTGMRLSEALHARWEWIDWNEKTVTLEEDSSDGWDPKTEAGRRTLPLSPELFMILKNEKAATGYIFFRDSEQTRDNLRSARLKQLKKHMKQVLAKVKGIKLSRSTPQTERDWLEKELKKIDVHALRYTYITELVAQNADPKTVQYLAGHADITTTMGIYAQHRKENSHAVISRLKWSKNGSPQIAHEKK